MLIEPIADDQPAPDSVDPHADPERIILDMPIDVRSTSLGLIGFAVGIYMLNWASAVFIPVLLGVMLSYAMSPLVARLEVWRVPRLLGAAVVIATLASSVGAMLFSLRDDAAALVVMVQ